MAAHSVVLGGTTLGGRFMTYDVKKTPKFKSTNDTELEYVEWEIQLRAAEVQSTPGAIVDNVVSVLDLVDGGARDLSIKLDGTEKIGLLSADCIVGPAILDFSTERADGAGEQHWRYNLSIYARERGDSDG